MIRRKRRRKERSIFMKEIEKRELKRKEERKNGNRRWKEEEARKVER